MDQLDVFAGDYDPDTFFKVFKDNIGKHPDLTRTRYNASYRDYCKRLLAERQGGSTLSIGQQGKTQKKSTGVRPIALYINDNLALLGMMSCPTGNFQFVDLDRISDFDRFIDLGNQGKRMELVTVYWSSNAYAYNLVKSLLRSQRQRRTTLKQGIAKLNTAISSKAANLYGWVNGKIADWRRDDQSGYIDDETDHPGMIEF
jgi:hypothetical protein